MPTTPHPAHHSDSNTTVTSTDRKEFPITMTSADSHPEADRSDSPCPCGALAEGNGLCLKCRARATWQRRQVNRERRTVRRRSSSRPTGRGSHRPQGRRPGR
ncbi:MAG: hypothetical protein ACRDRY_06215 [Pseudonocardiaceae bacterium]